MVGLTILKTGIFTGKALDPYGKAKSHLMVQFKTEPVTLSLTQERYTNTDGVWTVEDSKIVPHKSYEAILSY